MATGRRRACDGTTGRRGGRADLHGRAKRIGRGLVHNLPSRGGKQVDRLEFAGWSADGHGGNGEHGSAVVSGGPGWIESVVVVRDAGGGLEIFRSGRTGGGTAGCVAAIVGS